MPGSYFPNVDAPQASLCLSPTNARSSFFIPPTSPTAASNLSNSHFSLRDASTYHNRSRKRPRRRDGPWEPRSENPIPTKQSRTTADRLSARPSRPSAFDLQEPESPAPLVNTQYRLANGLDSASIAKLDEEELRDGDLQELDYRPSRMSVSVRQAMVDDLPQTPEISEFGQIGRKRARSADRLGWEKVVVNVVGAAGKVINFCWNSAFRGFQAGGGQAYRLDTGTPTLIEQSIWTNIDEKDDVFNHRYQSSHPDVTPVPGQFPDEVFISDYMDRPRAYDAASPNVPDPGGHREGDSVKGNWVFVNTPEEKNQAVDLRGSRTRPSTGSATTRARIIPTRMAAGSPSSRLCRPASYAPTRVSPNKPLIREIGASSAGNVQNGRSRPSVASPRRSCTRAGAKESHTIEGSPEVQRFEKRIRRKERQEDESIDRLNRQLQDMIKEGKEALATTFEIGDDFDEDEGYGEGSEDMVTSKW